MILIKPKHNALFCVTKNKANFEQGDTFGRNYKIIDKRYKLTAQNITIYLECITMT